MYFFEFDTLEKELSALAHLHRVAFAASCCERMLPNYNAFCRMFDWGNPNVPQNAMNKVWQILQGELIDSAIVEKLREDCGSEEVFPDDLDFGGGCYEAQETLMAIRATLAACINPDVQLIIQVAKCARHTIEAYIPYKDSSFNVSWEKDGEEKFVEAISSHPFAVREMAKESEDLQKLKDTELLDRDFLECLRTSFDNEGKSLIDLG